MVDWPTGISFIEKPDAYQRTGPKGNIIRSPMDTGPSKTRRRFTAAVQMVSGETDIISDADVAVFEDWFTTSIADGALSFYAADPKTLTIGRYKFVETYELIHVDDDKNRLVIKLEKLP